MKFIRNLSISHSIKYNIYSFFVIVLILSAEIKLYTQPVLEWSKRFDGQDHLTDNSSEIAVDKFGNVYVTGTVGYNPQTAHIGTIKYNSSGVQQWVQIYNKPGAVADQGYGITVDDSGDVYVTGSSGDFFTNIYDITLLKYNSSGILQWARFYDGVGGPDDPSNILVDKQGNIVVAGTTPGFVVILKYNSIGDTLWTRRFAQPGYSFSYTRCLSIDSLNNICIGGHCNVNINYSGDFLVIKYSSIGEYLWSRVYNSGAANTSDIVNAIGVNSNGDIYATGRGNYSGDFLTIKYNSSGTQQWLKEYNSGSNQGDASNSLSIDRQGNVIVTGTVNAIGTSSDICTIKYDPNGDTTWVKKFDGINHEEDGGIIIFTDSLNNIYVSGFADSSGYYRVVIVKYNSNGNQIWSTYYPGVVKDMRIDRHLNIYLVGDNSENGTGPDFMTLKYSQITGIIQTNTELPKEFILYQNYPNPFNPSTLIDFELPENNHVSLKIFNVTGREVETLINYTLRAGSYSYKWDSDNNSSGIYFYTLKTKDFSKTKKMILIK